METVSEKEPILIQQQQEEEQPQPRQEHKVRYRAVGQNMKLECEYCGKVGELSDLRGGYCC